MDAASITRLFCLAALWGASFLFMRVSVPAFGPVALIMWRVAIAAVFLWLASRLVRQPLRLGHRWKHFLIIGILNSALPFLLFAYAAQTLPASLLAILNATSPLFGAAIGAVWLRTSLTGAVALGLGCGLAGVTVLVGQNLALVGGSEWAAIAAGLLAPLSYSLASLYTRARPGLATPFDNAHGSMWMATLVVLPLFLFAPLRQAPDAADWLAVALLGVLCTGAAYLLYFRLIDDVGATRALSVTFLIPVFGVLWGTLFLDEAIGWHTVLGGTLILTGIALTAGLLGARRQPA
ncbi:MAG: DMT family transporter [Candidatus Accumulibacter sp.]|uniref:DMT family transporter n=1 Tax=Accumulibacter sp. TaxID=2053492 RepID=UPI0019E6EDFD|nr:DMT family transporter [Accumulibacter sp.]MBE2259572.1 DMT family transporter [Paracoccaceae bacterium]MCP5248729.1 DMT family transporter [Accumulibacter sp.]